MNEISVVYCLWKYKETPTTRYESKWELMNVIPMDHYGNFLKENPYQRGRSAYSLWIEHKVWWDKEKNQAVTECPAGCNEEDYDWDEIFGRMVTIWTIEHGIQLRHFSPPENTPWLTIDFGERLTRLPNWWEYVDGGGAILGRTTRVVQDLLLGETDGSD